MTICKPPDSQTAESARAAASKAWHGSGREGTERAGSRDGGIPALQPPPYELALALAPELELEPDLQHCCVYSVALVLVLMLVPEQELMLVPEQELELVLPPQRHAGCTR